MCTFENEAIKTITESPKNRIGKAKSLTESNIMTQILYNWEAICCILQRKEK